MSSNLIARSIFHRVVKASELFKLPGSLLSFQKYFSPRALPWKWVPAIETALLDFDFTDAALPEHVPTGVHIEGNVHIHPSVKLPPYCVIEGPAYIGPETQIRPGAYLRGNVIVGRGCVLGNSSEFKNCLLMDAVETAHFNYIGDSILGNAAHLGAGVILANLRLQRDEVFASVPEGKAPTGLKKLGAILGEKAEVGCNTVLQPGTIMGKRSLVYPAIAFGGHLPENSIALRKSEVEIIPRRK